MVYSQFFQQKEKKVPTFFLFILIIGIIFSISRFINFKDKPKRAERKTIRRLEIANLTSNQVTIYWQTEKKSVGYVIYGESEKDLDQTALDDRDLPDRKISRRHHLTTVRAISGNKNYFFRIMSDDRLVSDQNDKAFVFKTPSSLTGETRPGPAYGKVIGANQSPLKEAIVILSFDSSYPFITLTRESGEWLIAYNTIVEKNTLKTRHLVKSENVTTEIYSENDEKSTIQTDISSLSPLPQTIIIGRDYTFENKSSVLSASTSIVNMKDKETISIVYPKEGSIIPGDSPLIKGGALPGKEVVLFIAAKTSYSYKVFADKSGSWTVKISSPLPAGKYSLTMYTKNETGKDISVTRAFTIAKSGEQVLGEATGSATPTVTAYISPTVQVTSLSTPSATPPVTGGNVSPWLFMSGAFIIVGLGVLLAF